MAIHILSVEHCALNRIAEVSSPEKFPTSENKDRAQALSRGSKIGLRGGRAEKRDRQNQTSKSQVTCSEESNSADKRIRAG